MKWLLFGLIAMIGWMVPENNALLNRYLIKGTAQGTTYHITYVAGDSVVLASSIDSIFKSLDSALSIYKPFSLINKFNSSSRGVVMDNHLQKICLQSIETNRHTMGVFDITILPITEVWGFGAIEKNGLPNRKKIRELKKCVGSNKLEIKGDSLIKKDPCVRLDPNGIAQGYTADVLANFLESKGVHHYLAEIGGEMRVKGMTEKKEPFTISIEQPSNDTWAMESIIKNIRPGQGAITTSGNYRKFVESTGRKISHIIDARTGYPARNELISVTVFAKDAITADALDNSFMAMGLKKSFAFCNAHKEISAYFIYRKKDGSIADTATASFPKFINRP